MTQRELGSATALLLEPRPLVSGRAPRLHLLWFGRSRAVRSGVPSIPGRSLLRIPPHEAAPSVTLGPCVVANIAAISSPTVGVTFKAAVCPR